MLGSADGKSVLPVFGNLFTNEPIPTKGFLDVTELDKPGFGLEVNVAAPLIDATRVLNPDPPRSLDPVGPVKQSTDGEANGVRESEGLAVAKG